MRDAQDAVGEATKRLDAFVDAAFAFAVSLLIIASAEPTTSISALWSALGRVPASLGAFALVVMFWLAYRDWGRLTPRRDMLATLNALAIVFTVLVYVFPLRMLVETGFGWVSQGRLGGGDIIRTLGDLRDLFRIYGIGFAVLAALFVTIYLQPLRNPQRFGVASGDIPALRESARIWAICASAGLLSAALTFGPLAKAPWLPGLAYWLIPLSVLIRASAKPRSPGLAKLRQGRSPPRRKR